MKKILQHFTIILSAFVLVYTLGINAVAAELNVTVPAVLPITVSADGAVVTATDAKITNNGTNAVSVSSLKVTPAAGWSIVSESEAVAAAPGANVMALSFQGQPCAADGTVDTTAWSEIAGGTSMGMTYTAKIPRAIQPSAGSAASAVIVVKEQPSTPTTLLSDISEGSIIKLNENGRLTEFYVVKHNYEPDLNGKGRTLLLRKDIYDQRIWSHAVYPYKYSSINTWLNDAYKNLLDADVRAAMGSTKFTTSVDYLKMDTETIERSVFLLSATEFGASNTSFYNTEGSAVPNSDKYQMPHQWTRSIYFNAEGYVGVSGMHGTIGFGACDQPSGSRPAFTLPEDIIVREDGSIRIPIVTEIEVITPPNKTEYLVEESFDPAGMVVTATFENGKTKVLMDGDYTISNGDKLAVDQTSIAISYKDPTGKIVSTIVQIKVSAPPIPALSDFTEGSTVRILENGQLVEFYIVKHNYEPELNGEGRTLLLRKEIYDIRQWNGMAVNSYESSAIDSWLNNTYRNLFDSNTQAAIGSTKFYYTPGGAYRPVQTLERSIFLLSTYELGITDGVGTAFNAEGSILPNAASYQICKFNGSFVGQWTRTPSMTMYDCVIPVTTTSWGSVGWGNYLTHSPNMGSRPAFTVPESCQIDENGILHLPGVKLSLAFEPGTGTISGYETKVT